ncbi:MAG TPA: alpha/beta fold hydrolase [Steroidobacteraceae bacterium]|nr:alpha/beta fold hydrolase [Steroidobacteraceae bacterium]
MAAKQANLIILPGSMCDRWAYAQQIDALASDYEIRVPHLLGASSLEAMAQLVLEAGPPQFALVGHAMGGRVALEIIRRAPERVTALALLATTVHPIREGEGPRRQTQIDLARTSGMAALAAEWLPRVVHPAHCANAALMQGLAQMYARFTPEDYECEVRALLNRPDPRPVLATIRCPTLVLSGREDPLCTPEQSAALAAQIPGASCVILEVCAHFPSVEQPLAVTRHLSQLLRRD